MSSPDIHHLQRFLDAQESVYPQVHAELTAGEKRSHWMWFIFPQLKGLGSSPTAQRFAISCPDEAVAFLAHPTLGPRLRECVSLVLHHPTRSVETIFGYPDHLKFHSSVTLFHAVAPTEEIFAKALDTFFSGKPDAATLRLLPANA